MPIDRLDRARATLPEGYQFGDGAVGRRPRRLVVRAWRSKDGAYHCRIPQRFSYFTKDWITKDQYDQMTSEPEFFSRSRDKISLT